MATRSSPALLGVLAHELVHAMLGLDENLNELYGGGTTEYRPLAVVYSNLIYMNLGISQQNSYLGQDYKGILTPGVQYTEGNAIHRSVVIRDRIVDWDSSNAGNSHDLLIGDERGNRITAGNGNDYLYGNGGSDELHGDADNDVLVGGAGNDTLFGGTGTDIYRFAAADGPGTDTIDDSDHDGILQFDGHELSGGRETRPGSGEWVSADGAYHFYLVPETNPLNAGPAQNTLLIQAGDSLDLVSSSICVRCRPHSIGCGQKVDENETTRLLRNELRLIIRDRWLPSG